MYHENLNLIQKREVVRDRERKRERDQYEKNRDEIFVFVGTLYSLGISYNQIKSKCKKR